MNSEISPTDTFNSLYDAVLASEDAYGNYDASAQDALYDFLDTPAAKNSTSVQAEAHLAGLI